MTSSGLAEAKPDLLVARLCQMACKRVLRKPSQPLCHLGTGFAAALLARPRVEVTGGPFVELNGAEWCGGRWASACWASTRASGGCQSFLLHKSPSKGAKENSPLNSQEPFLSGEETRDPSEEPAAGARCTCFTHEACNLNPAATHTSVRPVEVSQPALSTTLLWLLALLGLPSASSKPH